MMNQDTRRLSKMPQEVLAEISPYFLDKQCIKNNNCNKIKKLNDDAPYIRSDLVVHTHPKVLFNASCRLLSLTNREHSPV